MNFVMRESYEVVQMEHEQRMREAEMYRRANEARQHAEAPAAAPNERRFPFSRFPFTRPSEA